MIRRPPRSTRTDTLFPYTTLFRSYEEHSDEKRLAYNANWTCRSHAFKKNIMKDDLIVEAVADGDNDAIRAILADVCSLTNMGFAAVARVTEDRWIACQEIGRASCRGRGGQYW